ncbi:MAG: efflux RND transporter permease subunit, partial [Termitinemataceae bacterium]
ARDVAEFELRARFRRIEGLASVLLVGGEEEEIKVRVDLERAAARGTSPLQVARTIGSEWIDVPAGSGRTGDRELVIVSSGRPQEVEELSRLVLPSTAGPLYTRDVGTVTLGGKRQQSIAMVDGKSAVLLELYRREGANPLTTGREIRKELESIQRSFTRDVEIFLVYDGTAVTRKDLSDLGRSALAGLGAVVLALIFFIRSIRGSLLTALSIPLSAAASVAVLAVSGKGLNGMSLGGLTLGIGLVSDTAVVVLELLDRTFVGYPTKPEAAEVAACAASLGLSSLGSTLTTAVVFVPVLFLPGPLGALYGDLSVALLAAILTGWLYAQFALPSLYRLFWKPEPPRISNSLRGVHTRMLHHIDQAYRWGLRWVLRQPRGILLPVLIAVLAGGGLLMSRPLRFAPPEGATELVIELGFPPGTDLSVLEAWATEAGEQLRTVPGIHTVFGRSGSEPEDTGRRVLPEYQRELLSIRCLLTKGAEASEVQHRIRAVLEPLIEETALLRDMAQLRIGPPQDPIERVLGLSATTTIALRSENPDILEEKRNSLVHVLESACPDGVFSWRPSGTRPEIRLYPKREQTAQVQISALNLVENLHASTEGIRAAQLELQGRPIDIRVSAQLASLTPWQLLEELKKLPVMEGNRTPIFLGSLVDIEQTEGKAALARLDRSDVVYIDGSLKISSPLARKKLRKTLETLVQQREDLMYTDDSSFSRYKITLLSTIILVVLLLYFLLASQFESFLLPLIILLTLPFAIAGAGPLLALCNAGIDSGSIIGLVVLFGLAVNNAIILYEVSIEYRNRGCSWGTAIYTGTAQRLRAILATTATTLLALLPLLLSPLGATQRSMAAAMFGGVAASTLLSLFAMPVILKWYFDFFGEKER